MEGDITQFFTRTHPQRRTQGDNRKARMPKIKDLDGVGPVKREREEIPEVNNQVRERTVSCRVRYRTTPTRVNLPG